MLSSIAPLLLVSLGLAPSAHAWWWEGDDYDRTARVAAIVVGLLAGTALILFAVFYAIRRQRKVAAEFAEFRPPPPPGVVGYDVSRPSFLGISDILACEEIPDSYGEGYNQL